MAPTKLRLPTPVLLMTPLVLLNTMASALPSTKHALSDVSTAKTTRSESEPTPRTQTDVESVVNCPGGYYFSEEAAGCRRCSGCPVNQIIRTPCSARANTVCGPFFEFDRFHQSPVVEKTEREERKEESRMEEPRHRQASGPTPGGASHRTIRLQDGGHWRTLSFALIAVLSFICCIVVIVGVYVCVILRRSQTQRFILREPESLTPHLYSEVDSEARYVELPATSRHYARSLPHPPLYQQIFTGCDAVFPSLTSSACDAKRDGEEERENLCVYVNTAALQSRDS